MGKMNEKFTEEMDEQRGAPTDADYQDYLYHQDKKGEIDNDDCCGNNCHCEPATQEEIEKNNKAWWDSMTEDQKSKLIHEFDLSNNFFNFNKKS